MKENKENDEVVLSLMSLVAEEKSKASFWRTMFLMLFIWNIIILGFNHLV